VRACAILLCCAAPCAATRFSPALPLRLPVSLPLCHSVSLPLPLCHCPLTLPLLPHCLSPWLRLASLSASLPLCRCDSAPLTRARLGPATRPGPRLRPLSRPASAIAIRCSRWSPHGDTGCKARVHAMIIYKFKSKTRSLLDRLASRLSFKVLLLVSCLLIFGTKSLPRPKSLSPSFFETMACPGEAVPAHLGRFSRRPLGTWWAIW